MNAERRTQNIVPIVLWNLCAAKFVWEVTAFIRSFLCLNRTTTLETHNALKKYF